jgi:hypothetical protein
MRSFIRCFAVAFFALFTWQAALAEVKVTVEANHDSDATADFKFKKVPGPVKDDAAAKATFSIVDGNKDDNSGDLSVTHDGKLPTEEDQPDRNFFFAQNDDGGRLSIDLGKAIDIKQVNSYSWHPNTRGPQVYKLYAADGTEKDFNAEPKKDTDPTKCGWKLIAKVDTRPANGDPGGQYGVSIADSAGTIGKYRYLLFDISETEKDDAWGNTFYSRFNVIEADSKKPSDAKSGDAKRTDGKLISQSPDSAKYHITIDYTEAPDLGDWVKDRLQPTCDKWYPKIVEMLPSDGFNAPTRASIIIYSGYRGVAATGGTHVMCDINWFRRNKNGEALGAVVHELVHVAQQYRGRRGGARNPGWLVEGIPDYIRWFLYEPKPTGTRPRSLDTASYTDSYRTTAGFLNYVIHKHDKDLAVKLNAAMRQGKYSPDLWKDYTGKSVDDLWQDYIATLK